MFCPNCGTSNPEGAPRCSACQAAMPGMPAMNAPTQPPAPGMPPRPAGQPSIMVESYLIPSILVTVLCCLPLGIPAIIYATQVQTKRSAGDVYGAQMASKNAKMWCWIAGGVSVGFIALYVVLIIIGGAMSNWH